MIGRIYATAIVFAVCTAAGAATLPPIVGDEGATYDDLIHEEKLVTFVLNVGARATNYRIQQVNEAKGTFSVIDGAGVNTAFTFSDIREVRVQRERIDRQQSVRKESALTTEDRKIVDDATTRALELFEASRGNQVVRILAATALAGSGHEMRQSAEAYLKELMEGNDAPTAVVAAAFYWLVGGEPSDQVISAGLASGNRQTRAQAALLVGLIGDQNHLLDIRKMLKDPAVEIFPSAAKTIARLDDRESLPALYEGIQALSDEKGEACVFALAKMGGSDVHQRLLTMLPNARGNEWFRIVRVLHALGDEQAAKLLRDDALRQPAFQREAALILVKEGSVEALQFLRDYLAKPQDPNVPNLVYKARVGLALFEAGDIQAKGIIQDVLSISPAGIYAKGRNSDVQYKEAAAAEIQIKTIGIIGDSMHRDLLSLLGAPIQSPNPVIATAACFAAVEISNPELGQRERESNK